jgi:hypothetical protein
MLFAAAHESVSGTFRTSVITLTMSAHRGRPDVPTGNDGIVDGAHHMIPCNATSVTGIYLEGPASGDIETDGGAGGCNPRAGQVGPRSNPGTLLF